EGVAPLHAARTSRRDVPTPLNTYSRRTGENQGEGYCFSDGTWRFANCSGERRVTNEQCNSGHWHRSSVGCEPKLGRSVFHYRSPHSVCTNPAGRATLLLLRPIETATEIAGLRVNPIQTPAAVGHGDQRRPVQQVGRGLDAIGHARVAIERKVEPFGRQTARRRT